MGKIPFFEGPVVTSTGLSKAITGCPEQQNQQLTANTSGSGLVFAALLVGYQHQLRGTSVPLRSGIMGWGLIRIAILSISFFVGLLLGPHWSSAGSKSVKRSEKLYLRCGGTWPDRYARVESTRAGSNCVPAHRLTSPAASSKEIGLL